MPLIFSRRLTLASISYAANTVLDIFRALLHWIRTMVFLSLSVRAIIKCTYRWEIWYLVRLRVRVVLNYLNPLINFYLQLLKEIWMWRGWGAKQESHIDGARIIKACASSSLYLDPNLFRGSLEIFSVIAIQYQRSPKFLKSFILQFSFSGFYQKLRAPV